MTAITTLETDSGIDRIFGPVLQARTYRNVAYLLISYPFGILSFVMMIAGLSTGLGLAIILVGFLILALTLALARVFGTVERRLMEALLGAQFEPRAVPVSHGRLPARLTDPRSWLTAMYFVVRFPLVVIGFVASILMLASVMVIAAPLLYTMIPLTIGFERVTTSEEAILASLIGCVMFLLLTHAVNGLASISRRLAVAML